MNVVESTRKWKVYKHTNVINNKSYIGMTSQTLIRRFGKNGVNYKNNRHFWNAIQKYGWCNFIHETIIENISKEEAENLEIKLICSHDLQNPKYGYNHSSGGLVNSGFHLSDETKRKLSEINKGKNSPNFGKHLSDETKEKISKGQKNRKIKIGKEHHSYGTHLSDEIKAKIRKSKIGNKLSEQHKRNISLSISGYKNPNYNKKFSLEHRIKISESKKGKNNIKSKSVFCKELNTVFDSIREAERKIGIRHEYISKNCRGKLKFAGKDTNDNPLHWTYI